MTARALHFRAVADRRGQWGEWLTARPALTALLVLCALIAINPVGFRGGDGDEYQYLVAARCAAEHGFCLPHDHWWRRWPIVLPSAATIRMFGESYLTLALVPLAYTGASVALLAAIAARAFGRAAGTIAGVIFAATPIVIQIAPEMGIDMPEFLFCLMTTAFVQRAYARGGWRSVASAGLAAGLAIQARPTALTLLPIFATLFLVSGRRAWIVPFLLSAAVPSVIEVAIYGFAAADPLLGWKLSLAHVRVPSSELLPTVDTRHSPLFNPEFIGGWRRPVGIHVHWAVDGILNYVFNPAVALPIVAALLLLMLDRRWVLRRPDLVFALLLGVAWFGALTYGFAIDPKPRMFLPTLGVACVLFGAVAARRWPINRALIVAASALMIAKGAIASYERIGLSGYAAAAPQMIAAAGPTLTTDPRSARFLALVPAARVLPVYAGLPSQRLVLLVGEARCSEATAKAGYSGWHVRASLALPHSDPAVIAALRRHSLFFSPAVIPVMCVIARD